MKSRFHFSKILIRSVASAVFALIPVLFNFSAFAAAGESYPLPLPAFSESFKAKSVILTEETSGEILYERNSREKLPVASVTKITALLLFARAIDGGQISLDDKVCVSENAAGMGGSQIYLAPGEEMSVHELLKCVVVASANDACTALAEHTAGSAEAFIAQMNTVAKELGANDTNYKNVTGLDEEGHYSTAYDVALIARELLKHKFIFNYTKIYTDSTRQGKFALVNTNRLIRFYKGATGLKTGFTGKAKYCLCATAERNGLPLIAVVLGGESSSDRFESAKALLNYGFSSLEIKSRLPDEIEPLNVVKGEKKLVKLKSEAINFALPKAFKGNISQKIILPDKIAAPVVKGQNLGCIEYECKAENGVLTARAPVYAAEDVKVLTYRETVLRIFGKLLAFI